MNKKGFTLVELLAVIVILALLAIVSSTVVFKLIDDSRKDLYNDQIELIEKSAEKWTLENVDLVGYNVAYCLDVDKLVKSGHLKEDTLKDPRDDSDIKGYVKITYDSEYKQFEYNYTEECSVN